MTWTRTKVARKEIWSGTMPVVVGWDGLRDCGCRYMEGIRIDRPTPDEKFPFEPVFGAYSCDQHHAQADRAMEAVKDMPPSNEPQCDLWERLLDREIES